MGAQGASCCNRRRRKVVYHAGACIKVTSHVLPRRSGGVSGCTVAFIYVKDITIISVPSIGHVCSMHVVNWHVRGIHIKSRLHKEYVITCSTL